ncbi:MAG TPA: hypothetical protein VFR75_06600, partial [Solirubrobacterales bacterium]|nr:hypothetical protein [Solirubrobacterales bacterium]
RGLAATERNLHALCDQLRSTLHEEMATRAPNGRRRPYRLVVLAAVFAAFGGGLAIGMAAGDEGGQSTVVESAATDSGPEETKDEIVTDEQDADGQDVTDENVVTDEKEVEPPGGAVTDEAPPVPGERLPPVAETNPPTPEFETTDPPIQLK